jgi:hypothetical protein
MSTYPNAPPPAGQLPLAKEYVRASEIWRDKLTLATLQTFGVSTAAISQLQWSGIPHEENAHGTRCAIRNQHLLDWFESQLLSVENGFVPGVVSAQDIFLTCWCQFIERRPLRLTWEAQNRPKVAALVARLASRPSFKQEPALWWEPGVTYAAAAEEEWAQDYSCWPEFQRMAGDVVNEPTALFTRRPSRSRRKSAARVVEPLIAPSTSPHDNTSCAGLEALLRNIAPLPSQALHFGKPQKVFPRCLSAIDEFDKPRKREVGIWSRMQLNLITRRNQAGLSHTIVPTGSTASHHRARQALVAEPQSELETGLPRLTNL